MRVLLRLSILPPIYYLYVLKVRGSLKKPTCARNPSDTAAWQHLHVLTKY